MPPRRAPANVSDTDDDAKRQLLAEAQASQTTSNVLTQSAERSASLLNAARIGRPVAIAKPGKLPVMRLEGTKTLATTRSIAGPALSQGRRNNPYDFPTSPEKSLPKAKAPTFAKPGRPKKSTTTSHKSGAAGVISGSTGTHRANSAGLGSEDIGAAGGDDESAGAETVVPRKSGRLAGEKLDLSSVQWEKRPEKARSITPTPKRKASDEPSAESHRPQKSTRRDLIPAFPVHNDEATTGEKLQETRHTSMQPQVLIHRYKAPKPAQDTLLQEEAGAEDSATDFEEPNPQALGEEDGSHASPADEKPLEIITTGHLASTPVKGIRSDKGSPAIHQLDEGGFDFQSSPPKRKARRKVDKLAGILFPEVVKPRRVSQERTAGAGPEARIPRSSHPRQQATTRIQSDRAPRVEEAGSLPKPPPATVVSEEVPESSKDVHSAEEAEADKEADEDGETPTLNDQQQKDHLAEEEVVDEGPVEDGDLPIQDDQQQEDHSAQEVAVDEGAVEISDLPMQDQQQEDVDVEAAEPGSDSDASFQLSDSDDYEDKLHRFFELGTRNGPCQTECGRLIRKLCTQATSRLRRASWPSEERVDAVQALCDVICDELAVASQQKGSENQQQLQTDAYAVLFSHLASFFLAVHGALDQLIGDTIDSLPALNILLPLLQNIQTFHESVSAWGMRKQQTSTEKRRVKEVEQLFIDPLQKLQDRYQLDQKRRMQEEAEQTRKERKRRREEEQRREDERGKEELRREEETRRIREAGERRHEERRRQQMEFRKERWRILHLRRLKFVTSLNRAQRRHFALEPLQTRTERDANQVEFIREEVFCDRLVPFSRPMLDEENGWSAEQETALMEGLEKYGEAYSGEERDAALDIFPKIFQEYCRRGGPLRDFNVTEITAKAAHFRTIIEAEYQSKGWTMPAWVSKIPILP